MSAHGRGRAVVVTAAAVVVYWVGSWLPVPGVDEAAMTQLVRHGGAGGLGRLFNLAPPPLSPFGESLLALVVVRGLLALGTARERPRALPYRLGFVGFLVLAALLARHQITQLERAGTPAWAFLPPIVESPALACLSLVAGAALLWALASAITRQGLVQGPLLLLAARHIPLLANQMAEIGVQVAQVGALDAPGLLGLAGPLAVTVGLAAVWRWRPAAWPLHLAGGLEAGSPLDLALSPLVASALAATAITAGLSVLPADRDLPGTHWLAHVDRVVGLACAIAIALWLRRRAVGRGAVGWLAGALVLPILAFSIAAVAAALTAQALPPPPFRGPDTVDVVLTSPGGDAQHDAPLVRARMVALGVAARVLAAGGGRITMRLPRVQKVAELVQQVGARKELALFWAADDQAPLAQALAGRPLPSGREVQASLVAALKLGPGQRAAIECKEPPEEAPGPPTCKPWLLVAPPVLATRDLARAEVAFDPMDGRPRISVELHAASVPAFADATGRNVGKRLAIMVDGEIMSLPIVMSQLGGRLQITLGSGAIEAQLVSARLLAAALSSGPLSARWSLLEMRAAD
ncbi:MAG TPA: hypothetical protein VKN99_02960 [Polyangia bacterium]|nr:hypothetical protein [Polyangia bacterium]